MFDIVDSDRIEKSCWGFRIHPNVHRKTERHLQLVAGGTTTTIIESKSAFPSSSEACTSFVQHVAFERCLPFLLLSVQSRKLLRIFSYNFPIIRPITFSFRIFFASLDGDNKRQLTATLAGITSANKIKPNRQHSPSLRHFGCLLVKRCRLTGKRDKGVGGRRDLAQRLVSNCSLA